MRCSYYRHNMRCNCKKPRKKLGKRGMILGSIFKPTDMRVFITDDGKSYFSVERLESDQQRLVPQGKYIGDANAEAFAEAINNGPYSAVIMGLVLGSRDGYIILADGAEGYYGDEIYEVSNALYQSATQENIDAFNQYIAQAMNEFSQGDMSKLPLHIDNTPLYSYEELEFMVAFDSVILINSGYLTPILNIHPEQYFTSLKEHLRYVSGFGRFLEKGESWQHIDAPYYSEEDKIWRDGAK